jgi:hypothetical protein
VKNKQQAWTSSTRSKHPLSCGKAISRAGDARKPASAQPAIFLTLDN